MKAILFSSIAILFIGINAVSQTILAPFNPDKEAKKWGFINETGDVVIAAMYDEVLNFSDDGFALVCEGKLWSVINESNEKVSVEAKGFTPVGILGFGKRGFTNGLLVASMSRLQGVIDTKGKIVHEFKYTTITDFENGYATAKIGKEFYILNADGGNKQVRNVKDLRAFKEGLSPFKTSNNTFGFIDVNGGEVINANFIDVGYFSNGLAWVKNFNGTALFIDESGETVIEAKCTVAKQFDKVSGIILVKSAEGSFYQRKNGETFTVNGATGLGDFSDGLAYAKMGEKVGFINDKGDWVIDPKFDKVRDFYAGFAAVRVGEKWGVINKKGEFVCEPQFDDIKNFSKVK